MTPKEKANELYDKFIKESFAGTEFYRNKNAQRTALLCVDEILQLELLASDNYYWLSVQDEINKL